MHPASTTRETKIHVASRIRETKKRRERVSYTVGWHARLHLWVVKRGRFIVEAESLKHDAVRVAADRARRDPPSELYIHSTDGRIVERRTYGADPERSPG